jgi:DnaJ family protein C protein 3
MALGKYNQALKDLDKVIELKGDFTTALLQRANLLLKQGKLDDAHVDFERVVRKTAKEIILFLTKNSYFFKF